MRRKQPPAPPSAKEREAPAAEPAQGPELLGSLLLAKGVRGRVPRAAGGLVVGELVGLADGGQIPLVTFPGLSLE